MSLSAGTGLIHGGVELGEPTMTDDQPLPRHQRPEGLDDLTVAAVGLLPEALERADRARGHLYTFHQLTGEADFKVGDAVSFLLTAWTGAASHSRNHLVCMPSTGTSD
jgi:hypothetical protein